MDGLLAHVTSWVARALPDADDEERARALVLVMCCVFLPVVALGYALVVPLDLGSFLQMLVPLSFLLTVPLVLRFSHSVDVALAPMLVAMAIPTAMRTLVGDPMVLDTVVWVVSIPVLGALVGRGVAFAVSVILPALLVAGVVVAHQVGWLVPGERAAPVAEAAAVGFTLAFSAILLLAYRVGVRRARQRLARANAALDKARVAAAQADRLATVGALATGVAHGVNNPLQAALDGVRELEGLLEGEPGSPTMRARGVTAEIGVALHQIRATVAALATFADPVEQGPGAPVELDELVRQVVAAVRGSASDTVQIRVRTDQLPRVLGNRNELAQVLMVLLRNASQAIDPARGLVSIDVIGGRTPQGGAFIEVRDDGVGMTDDVLGRAFEPFYTTRGVGRGAGLGLPLARNVMRHLGGVIELRSREGMGTVARIVLPDTLIAPPEEADAGPSEVSGSRILVVDDEPLPLRVVGRALSATFEVELELSPERALHRLRSGEAFDLVISDLMMPELTGDQLYTGVIEERPGLADRFVFVTGAVLDGELQENVRRTGRIVIQKPFDRDELVQIVSQAIALARTSERSSFERRTDTPTPTPH